MPRTPRDALFFLLGLWLCFTLLGPIFAARANAAETAIPQLEGRIHQGVNDFRRANRLIALVRRPDLDAVARAHSEDMVRRSYFSHETPEGLNWVDRLQAAGVDDIAMAGENVAKTNRRAPVNEVLIGWQRSPDHRRNLLARPFNTTGIGAARAPDGTLFVTQLYVTVPRD